MSFLFLPQTSCTLFVILNVFLFRLPFRLNDNNVREKLDKKHLDTLWMGAPFVFISNVPWGPQSVSEGAMDRPSQLLLVGLIL